MIKFDEYSRGGKAAVVFSFFTLFVVQSFSTLTTGTLCFDNVTKIGKLKKVGRKFRFIAPFQTGLQENFFHGIFGHLLNNFFNLQLNFIIDNKKMCAVFEPRWHEKPVQRS